MPTFITRTFLAGTTSDVVPAGAVSARVQCWAPGGSAGVSVGAAGTSRPASGAGGGGYGESEALPVQAGATINFQVGVPGTAVSSAVTANGNDATDTFWNAASYAAAVCGAQGGKKGLGSNVSTQIAGGLGGNGKGDIAFPGGNGGNATGNAVGAAAGGGGSGGPDGAGANGTDATSLGTNGGTGDNGNVPGGTGGATPTAGASDPRGGGGGGGGSGGAAGGQGGDFGGGSGGAFGTATTVANRGGIGKIVVTYLIADVVAPHKRRYRRAA